MERPDLDEVDYGILVALQEDARHNTNADISERLDVSASTISKRIAELENAGVIQGYRPEIDYERTGFRMEVLFHCTAPITEREDIVEQTLAIEGVVNVRELMTGRKNVTIRVVGTSKDDITRVAHRLDEIGYAVADEILLRAEHSQPAVHFGSVANPE